ncbi:MAG: bifunctional demethylmenaquinone methyltransferase/2-methoxy-6-polyprenyl-1,4-benzoquinol methylase UbiE [Bacteroidetes bacterium]|nr:bifunctional demethylmenaquinone methyltransferase/2-methoxy-6-polyprenyl-1,4-benzoquinol methylase UbiE [Bacteroidota bacterium]
MFDNIAHRYDFLNHLLSMGIDNVWRVKAMRFIRESKPERLLDIATGTGDLAFEARKQMPKLHITGLDLSEGMLSKAREKATSRKMVDMEFIKGDSENLNFEDTTFDAVSVAFGVRNFENLEAGLSEIYRVLKPGGKLAVLEFSKPKAFPVKQIFNFYFRQVLPRTGKMISKDSRAYEYLPESVQAFPEGKDFIAILERIGFKQCKDQALTFGICSLYTAEK